MLEVIILNSVIIMLLQQKTNIANVVKVVKIITITIAFVCMSFPNILNNSCYVIT